MSILKTKFTSIVFLVLNYILFIRGIKMNTVESSTKIHNEALSSKVVDAIRNYIQEVGIKDAVNLYQMIIEEVESPLFRTVMELTRYNQSKAARVLGLSRGTLRTKLKRYFDDEFIGTRD